VDQLVRHAAVVHIEVRRPGRQAGCYLSTPCAVSNAAKEPAASGLAFAWVGEINCFHCESTPVATLSIVLMTLAAARIGIIKDSIGSEGTGLAWWQITGGSSGKDQILGNP
jgi:hypothetical protein